MRKYANDNAKETVHQKIQNLVEQNAKADIYGLMKDIEHRIAMDLFNIRRVVDDGNFHLLLENEEVKHLVLNHHIPVCCKISLEGRLPPLHFKIKGVDKTDSMQIFCSFKDVEPSIDTPDVQAYVPYKRGELLRFKGEKFGTKPGQKIFVSKFLYLTFLSSNGGEIDVKPLFVDPLKANTIKYITTNDVNKMDTSLTGVDAPTLPPQKTMVNDFVKCK